MKRLKLLIVEDEPVMNDQTAMLFELYINIKIFKAKTGEEAMEIIHKDKPDLIILDLKLGDYPAMDGMGVLEQLRSFDAKTDVIVMTALPDISFEIGAIKLGTRLYLRKPFDITRLIDEVDLVLKEHGLKK